MITDKSTVKTEAVFSEDREYRYLLRKEWDNKKRKAAIIMTNPSISDMITTDYTTMFIINNLVKLDYGGFDILNLIPRISTKINLSDSLEIDEKIYDDNIKQIVKSAEDAEKVLIAWGSLNSKLMTSIKNEVLEALKPFETKLYTISNEHGGKSYHPLAPQIRSVWVFNKYDLKEMKEEQEVEADVENRDDKRIEEGKKQNPS